jgi:hypothetical protein
MNPAPSHSRLGCEHTGWIACLFFGHKEGLRDDPLQAGRRRQPFLSFGQEISVCSQRLILEADLTIAPFRSFFMSKKTPDFECSIGYRSGSKDIHACLANLLRQPLRFFAQFHAQSPSSIAPHPDETVQIWVVYCLKLIQRVPSC